MGLIELFLIAVGLSMDAFAVAVCKGLSTQKISWRQMCVAGLWFGGFQGLMPAAGYLLGSFFAEAVEKYAHWVSFALLAFIGANMIKEAFEEEEKLDASISAGTMFLLAVATSIDAFAVGVSFAFIGVDILPAVAFIGVITFILSALGIKVGSLFGTCCKSKAELAGGVVLIIIGLKTLIEGLM